MADTLPFGAGPDPDHPPTLSSLARSPVWHLYIVRCADGSLYTGISTDVARRLAAHRGGRGARRLRGRGPLELVFCEPVGDHGAALRSEIRVKRLKRLQKEQLVRGERRLPTDAV